MTPCAVGPWDVFETRVKRAISCAAHEHDGPRDLSGDVFACYVFLEQDDVSLEEIDSPVSTALQRALEHHRTLDRFQYDEAHAAMILLQVHEALEAEFGEPGR